MKVKQMALTLSAADKKTPSLTVGVIEFDWVINGVID